MIDVTLLLLPNGQTISVPVDEIPSTLLGWVRLCLTNDRDCDWKRASMWAKEQRRIWP